MKLLSGLAQFLYLMHFITSNHKIFLFTVNPRMNWVIFLMIWSHRYAVSGNQQSK